jgi:AcrR family transcriptional regulator
LVAQVEAALSATAENEERVEAAVAAYFDFVAGEGKAYRLIFGSDLRGDGADVVEDAMNRCIEKVADAVTTDAGLTRDRARLLSVGLVGLSQIAARYWLDSGKEVPKDEAVALMSSLAWRGLAGFPLIHSSEE